jgi:hypothetical protein
MEDATSDRPSSGLETEADNAEIVLLAERFIELWLTNCALIAAGAPAAPASAGPIEGL